MASIIQIRRDTAANWTSANPTLAQGELGLETDTLKLKAGDGSTAWNSASYLIDTGDYITPTFSGDVAITGSLAGDNIKLDGNAISSTTTNGNIQLFPNGTGFTELYGNTNAGAIRFNCESNSHGVTVKGPPHSAAATYSLELPDADGSAGQLLKTDGSGKLAFTSSLPGVTSTSAELNLLDGSTANTVVNSKAVIYGSSGEITATQLDLTGQGDLRLQDSTGGEYVGLQAPATVSSSYTLTFPSADGSADQVLTTNGSGVLSFADAGGGFTLSSAVSLDGISSTTFTGIPSTARVIIINFKQCYQSGRIQVQIGDSGGIETSGYESSSARIRDTSGTNSQETSTSYFVIRGGLNSVDEYNGTMILSCLDASSNHWVSSHTLSSNGTPNFTFGGGQKSLSGTLTQVKIGNETFNSNAEVSIAYL